MESVGGEARLVRAELLQPGLLRGAVVVPLSCAGTTRALTVDRLPPSQMPEPFQVAPADPVYAPAETCPCPHAGRGAKRPVE
jgi:hypothetical protein